MHVWDWFQDYPLPFSPIYPHVSTPPLTYTLHLHPLTYTSHLHTLSPPILPCLPTPHLHPSPTPLTYTPSPTHHCWHC